MAGLFDEMAIGKMTVSNRLVMPPMATGKASDGDNVPEEVISYYRDRARHSRVGLIITEHSYVMKEGKAHAGQVSISSDEDIPSLGKLVDAIHAEGVKVIAQINHAGSATSSSVTGEAIVGPSPVPHPRKNDEVPSELTKDQIGLVAKAFGEAALRARKAGFDGVEIHSAHGYLLNQFYSPLTNHRTDEYGPQSVESRTRIHREVIEAVRSRAGEDFLVAIRLGGCDYTEGGSTVEDAVEASLIFQAAGVDLVDISGGMRGYIRPGFSEPGYFQDMTTLVKAELDIPVVLTGGVVTLDQAEALVESGAADLVGVGRAIFRNPRWADQS